MKHSEMMALASMILFAGAAPRWLNLLLCVPIGFLSMYLSWHGN